MTKRKMTSFIFRNRGLLFLLAAGLVIRLVMLLFILPHGCFRTPDSLSYVTGAANILGWLHITPPVDYSYALERPPGYALFLAGIYLFATGDLAVVWVQMFLTLLATAGIWWLANRLMGPKVAFYAALVSIIDPLTLVLAAGILTEALFLAVMVILLFAAWGMVHTERRMLWSIIAALAVVWLAFMRVNALFLPLFLIPWIFAMSGGWRRNSTYAGVIVLILALGIGGWTVRNGLKDNLYTFNILGTWNAYYYGAGTVTACVQHKDLAVVQKELDYEIADSMRVYHWDLPAKMAYQKRYYYRTVMTYPWIYFRENVLKGLASVFGLSTAILSQKALCSTDFPTENRWARWVRNVEFPVMYAIFGLFLFGIWLQLRDRQYFTVILTLTLLIYTAVTIARAVSEPRYRAALEPMIWFMAGVSLARIHTAVAEHWKVLMERGPLAGSRQGGHRG